MAESLTSISYKEQGLTGVPKTAASKTLTASSRGLVTKPLLKRAITGEQLDSERKGVDATPMSLQTVFLFNINEAPNLKAALEAIQSRFAVLSFNKTYKEGADPSKGEIEADSRFRYDENFLKEKVCPALLNKMLKALSTLAIDGIDYSCTTGALQDIQEETNHLWAFAREVGLDYCTEGRIYVNDLWELLYRWYIDNGTLEIITENGKEKRIWHDQPRRGDKNVKAPNQIYQRFSELFPKIKKERDTSYRTPRTGQFYLSGIAIKGTEATEAITEATTEAITLTQSHTEATEAIQVTLAEILDQTKKLSSEQKRELTSIILSDKELTHLIRLQLSSGNSQTDSVNDKNLAEVEQTASVASVPCHTNVTASVVASVAESIASVEESTASVIAEVKSPTAEAEEHSTQTEAPLNRKIPQDLAKEQECSLIKPDHAKYAEQLEAIKNAPLLSLDIETYGENKREGLHPWRGNIRLIQLGLPDTTYTNSRSET
jgi:putative DNA primase/helicase